MLESRINFVLSIITILMVIDHCIYMISLQLFAPQSWHLLLNFDITPPAGKNVCFGGVKPKKLCKFFLWLYHVHKKYILQKNWSKTAIPALSSGPSNLPEPIYGVATTN